MDLPRTRHNPWRGLFLVAGLVACSLCPASAQIYINPEFLKWFVGEESELIVMDMPKVVTDISWHRGTQPSEDTRIISYQPPSKTWAPGPEYNSRMNVTSYGNLYFSRAEWGDTGHYTVRVATDREKQTATALFQVGEPSGKPGLSLNATSVAEYLDPVLATCHTDATKVLWHVNSRLVSSNDQMTLSPDNKTLTLHWVRRYDSVQCQIVNFKDEVQRSELIVLSVTYGPYDVSLWSKPQNVFDTIGAEIGSKVEINCTTLSCWPSPKYRWTHNGAPLSYSGHSITLWSLTKEQLGRYRCVLENPATGLSLYREVIVDRPRDSLQADSSFHLSGYFSGVLIVLTFLGGVSLCGLLAFKLTQLCSARRNPVLQVPTSDL
ncbi:carcinoembryonic antigen-related cell adhesion molecule 18 [Erinaceus europaeus]|uniref:Carcinoembryonic antigen-related cell adhesion molecule 18 n=1 Tax=Erinaceus europaeus TaxID=9365 RepID=A0ABM3W3M3_ERIEU|nr:carcinoembryonic antigen-related cell adhesion molecule 18 [Erinaceus europaeus]